MKIILVKDENGNIQRAENVAPIERKEIEQTIKRLQSELRQWETALMQYDRLAATDSPSAVIADDGDGHIRFDSAKLKKQLV